MFSHESKLTCDLAFLCTEQEYLLSGLAYTFSRIHHKFVLPSFLPSCNLFYLAFSLLTTSSLTNREWHRGLLNWPLTWRPHLIFDIVWLTHRRWSYHSFGSNHFTAELHYMPSYFKGTVKTNICTLWGHKARLRWQLVTRNSSFVTCRHPHILMWSASTNKEPVPSTQPSMT